MLYEERIAENLVNNFMSRREMVEMMLDLVNSNLEHLIVEKLKLSGYGNKLDYIFNEKDYFNFISYYYLFYINNKTEENLNDFKNKANSYLATFPDLESVTRMYEHGKDLKLKMYEEGVLK